MSALSLSAAGIKILSAAIIIASALLGFFIQYLIFKLLSVYHRRTRSVLVGAYIARLKAPLYLFTPILIISILLPPFSNPIIEELVDAILHILLTFSFAWTIIKIVYIFEDWLKARFEINKADNMRERAIRTQMNILRRIIIMFIFLVAISILLMSFGNVKELGAGILASAGVATAIVGFSAQKLLGNILAGFQIALTRTIRYDDALLVENEWGRVEDVTLTNVVVKIWDERRLVLPISYFIEKPFQNWTYYGSHLTGSIFIYADYSVDLARLREELTTILNSSTLWDKRVCTLQVTDSTEKTIQLRILVSAIDSSRLWDLRCYVREKIIQFLQKNYPDSLPKLRLQNEIVTSNEN